LRLAIGDRLNWLASDGERRLSGPKSRRGYLLPLTTILAGAFELEDTSPKIGSQQDDLTE